MDLFNITISLYSFTISYPSLTHPAIKNCTANLGNNDRNAAWCERVIDNFLLEVKELQKVLIKSITCFHTLRDVFQLLSNNQGSVIAKNLKSKIAISLYSYNHIVIYNVAYIKEQQEVLGEFISTAVLKFIKKPLIDTQTFLTNSVFLGKSRSSSLHNSTLKCINTASKADSLKKKCTHDVKNGGL